MGLNQEQVDRIKTIEVMIEILISEMEGQERTDRSSSHRHLRMARVAICGVTKNLDEEWICANI